MKIVVFGAGGYIGRHITEKFRQIEMEVICYSNSVSGVFDHTTGLLSDNLTISSDVDCVIYLSQSPFYRQMPEKADHLWGVNVVSAMKVAELSRQSGVCRFIYASTGNVYSPSFSPLNEGCPVRRDDWYALSKVHAEEALALYKKDMSITAARIFGVYGPTQSDKLVPNLVKSVRAGVPIKLAPKPNEGEDGGLRVSLCYIDDIVEIFTQLLDQKAPDVINVAGPEVLSVRHIAQVVGDQLGISPHFELGSQPRAFDLVADMTKLVEIYNPKFTPFAEGIKRTLEI